MEDVAVVKVEGLPAVSRQKVSKTGYSEAAKQKAALAFAQNQNLRVAADITEINYETIREWMREPWWAEFQEEYKRERRALLNTKLTTIVDMALEKVQDQIELGDEIYNKKTGETVRIAIPMSQVAKVAHDFLGQKLAIEKMDSGIREETTDVKDALKLLAAEFAKFNKKTKPQEIIDIEFKEVS